MQGCDTVGPRKGRADAYLLRRGSCRDIILKGYFLVKQTRRSFMKKIGSTTALGAGALMNGVPLALSNGLKQGGGTGLHVHQSGFSAGADGLPAGWTTWSARPEIATKTFIDPVHHRSRPGSLAIYGDTNASAYGGWEFKVDGVEPGKWYRFSAYYCADGVQCESWQIVSRLDWVAADGNRAGQPNYPYRLTPAGDWKQVTLDAPAPAKATGVKLQFYLANSPQGNRVLGRYHSR